MAPGDWDRIRAIMGPLDYPGTVFGVAASDNGTPMSDVARRYAAAWPCTTGITLSRSAAHTGCPEPAAVIRGRESTRVRA